MDRKWWKEGVAYQIYPKSFYDSNNDGIGDLRGIIEKLDYLLDLGIDIIWLCPVYKSPNDDNGYDISDYKDILDDYGTLADWEDLLEEVHKRKMKLIMDLVVNHTSDEHPWFIESRESIESAKRDYYMWRKGEDGKEPNNWASNFSGSAWEYDKQTDEYYLHLFSKKQPELNWENKKLRQEVYDIMTWWLDKGVDGFRMDAINYISKVQELPNAPIIRGNSEYQIGSMYYMNGPRIHEFLHEMNQEVLSKYDIVSVGETMFISTDEAIRYTSKEREELNMVFTFELMMVDRGKNITEPKAWGLKEFKKIVGKWQNALHDKGWHAIFLNNHDFPRAVSRFGNDKEYRVESAKMLATLLLTLYGTPFIYQGEEIGMTNVKFDSIDDFRDIMAVNIYNETVLKGSADPNMIIGVINQIGRDNARTPMQWNNNEHAGFTCGEPWIVVNPNYSEINVKNAQKDKYSILHHYKKLIKLRKENKAFIYGNYEIILEDNLEIFAYLRYDDSERYLVILNFSDTRSVFSLPDNVTYGDNELLISNYDIKGRENISNFTLMPYEARVYHLKI